MLIICARVAENNPRERNLGYPLPAALFAATETKHLKKWMQRIIVLEADDCTMARLVVFFYNFFVEIFFCIVGWPKDYLWWNQKLLGKSGHIEEPGPKMMTQDEGI